VCFDGVAPCDPQKIYLKGDIMKMFKSFKTKLVALFGAIGTAAAVAAPVTVDLSDAETSITNAGTAMIGLAVTILGIAVVWGFLRKRG
jgi:cell division GTPase FtsZ